jgi:pimeloyl-ACP methyl ester carboxylesterase
VPKIVDSTIDCTTVAFDGRRRERAPESRQSTQVDRAVKGDEDAPMPLAPVNGLEIWYDTFGDKNDPAVLLVMGLGGQSIAWDELFCAQLAERGFFVIRYDNRDCGLSTSLDSAGAVDVMPAFMKAMMGQPVDAPYLLSDMASDAVGVLDDLGIAAAHIVGLSMGGMIAQTIAIEHPDRVLTLTSISSTTGDRDVGQPAPAAATALMKPPAADRETHVANSVEAARVIGGPAYFDEERTRRRAGEAYDRAFNPDGMARQLLAIIASGPRTEQLRHLDVPTLVIHGSVDPLVTPSGGQRTAEVIPGAELVMIEGMGHDLPPDLWGQVLDAISKNAARAAA